MEAGCVMCIGLFANALNWLHQSPQAALGPAASRARREAPRRHRPRCRGSLAAYWTPSTPATRHDQAGAPAERGGAEVSHAAERATAAQRRGSAQPRRARRQVAPPGGHLLRPHVQPTCGTSSACGLGRRSSLAYSCEYAGVVAPWTWPPGGATRRARIDETSSCHQPGSSKRYQYRKFVVPLSTPRARLPRTEYSAARSDRWGIGRLQPLDRLT